MRKIIFVLLFGFAVAAVAQPTTYGPTTKADQLWQIAILVRPSAKVSVQQTMQALYKANPHAFVAGRLKPGSILKVPTLGLIKQAQPTAARRFMQEHQQSSALVLKRIDRASFAKLLAAYQVLQQVSNKNEQVILSMDQQYQVRFADLEKHNLALQMEVAQLKQRLIHAASQLKTLQTNAPSKPGSVASPYLLNPYVIRASHFVTGIWGFVSAAAIFVLMWLLSLFVYRGLSLAAVTDQESEGDESDIEDEYDFMGSEEGIPAKIDLARAYIGMGDKGTAKEVLQQVLKDGNEEQRKVANKLLEKCE